MAETTRAEGRFRDYLDILEAFFNKWKTDGVNPYARMDIIAGKPPVERFNSDKTSLLYIADPTLASQGYGQMGGARKSIDRYLVTIGCWITDDQGGNLYLQVIMSDLYDLMTDPSRTFSKSFTVTIDGVLSASRTLAAHGIHLDSISGPIPSATGYPTAWHSKYELFFYN